MNRSAKGNKVSRSQIVTLKEVDRSRSQIATLNNNASDIDTLVLSKIYVFREQQVMLDKDLASLYGVDVKRLNEQVKRNRTRFPGDFMFQLTREECSRSQIATLNGKRGSNLKCRPYVFTENGIAIGKKNESVRFHKTPSAVFAEPSAVEIVARVEHLIRLVCVARI